MFKLQSCRITLRERRGDASNMFTVHIATYESTFVDEDKEEYVYPGELIFINKVPTLFDCLNDTIGVFYKDTVTPIHKHIHKHITFFEISSMICSRCFDLYINGVLCKRAVDVEYLSEVYTLLRKNGLYVYDVTQSLIAPSEYNLIVEKEIKTC